MISNFRARKILGSAGKKLTDDEVELLISQCYAMAEITFEHFKKNEVKRKKEAKNAES